MSSYPNTIDLLKKTPCLVGAIPISKMPTQAEIIDRIVNLAVKNDDITAVWLYGSRARGTEQSTSDYDLAVMFQTYETDVTERRLRPEVLAMDWQALLKTSGDTNLELSIVDITQVPVPLAFTIVSDNKLLYAKDELKVMLQEQQIMSKWEIDYLYHVRHYA